MALATLVWSVPTPVVCHSDKVSKSGDGRGPPLTSVPMPALCRSGGGGLENR